MYKTFSKKLLAWYKKEARGLPWRRTHDPYRIWISEIMLQQTTVNAVIPYYRKWIKSFPTVRHVARAPLQKVLKAWEGLGYYQRAKNIHCSAQMICDEYQGNIPSTFDELKRLPGFGPYTVGAVLSIAFDQRQPIIDANVRRVVMRLRALRGKAVPAKDGQILKFLKEVMPKKEMSCFNQALMELGALICRNRQPLCIACPVRSMCAAYRQGIQEIIPRPKKTVIKKIEAVVAVIPKGNTFFIQKRKSKGLLADLWEFPGGKIKKTESPQEALHREIKEELGVEITSSQHIMNVVHYYTQFRVQLYVWRCKVNPVPSTDRHHRWVKRSQFQQYPMPSGSARIVQKLMASA